MLRCTGLTAKSKQGYAKHNHEICIARRLKAPRSANRASTPVKAKSMPPKLFQPSILFRVKYCPAYPGENALNTL